MIGHALEDRIGQQVLAGSAAHLGQRSVVHGVDLARVDLVADGGRDRGGVGDVVLGQAAQRGVLAEGLQVDRHQGRRFAALAEQFAHVWFDAGLVLQRKARAGLAVGDDRFAPRLELGARVLR